MKINKILLRNFRNLEDLEINFSDNINIFIGDNAQGKTNILESIYTLAISKSHRGINDIEMIQENKEFLKITGELITKVNTNEQEVIITKDSKVLKIDKNFVKRVSDYISTMKVIIFTPDDLEIIKRSPQYRRNLLNTELCQLYREYTVILNEYNKILKIRNDYLKNNNHKYDYNYIDILTEKLVDRIVQIEKYRSFFIEEINNSISKIFSRITNKEELSIVYEKSINLKEKNEIIEFYKQNIERDIFNRMTMYGPHRDDFIFNLENKNIKNYGSQGQQRAAILSFKLAEIEIFKKVSKEYPIILLDDVFSELDIKKRNNLIKYIKSNIQYFITTTDLKNINNKIVEKAKIFNVKNGLIAEKEGKKHGRKSTRKI